MPMPGGQSRQKARDTMSGIHRDTLRAYLTNTPLMQAIRQKVEIDETRKALNEADAVMQKAGISDAALNEVKAKVMEYVIISKNYGNMIDDTWQLTWQTVYIIEKYMDCDLDNLPEYAKF